MNRQEFLKSIVWLGAFSIFSNKLSAEQRMQRQIHLIGLGDAGTNAAQFFYQNNTQGKYTIINSARKGSIPNSAKFIEFNSTISKTSSKTGLTKYQRFIQHLKIDELKSNFISRCYRDGFVVPDEIENLFKRDEYFVLLAGLGGFTGNYLMAAILELLKEKQKVFSAICSTPYNFEGEQKQSRAKQVIKANGLEKNFYFIPCEEIRKKYPNLRMIDAFKTVDKEMYNLWERERAKGWV